MFDLKEKTFGETHDGVTLTLSSCADIQNRERKSPLGFWFKNSIRL